MDKLPIIHRLLTSDNPSIQYKARTYLLGESEDKTDILLLRNRIRGSENVRKLLSRRTESGKIDTNPYKKWQGPFWTLVSLALLEYPAGDTSLNPLRDQVYDWLLSEAHLKYPRTLIIPGQEDRIRRCAGQEAYAVWSTLKLGIADERTDMLVKRLIEWQWPDGGWNCDKRPQAKISSFHETLMPMRALAYYGQMRGDHESQVAARNASEVFLKRSLYRRIADGSVINPLFTQLTFPYFYHYNILFALLVMAETGYLADQRCTKALNLLQSKRREDGGFPLERRIFKSVDDVTTRGTFANWGPVGKRYSNEFVTVDALYILRESGKLNDRE